MNGLKKMRESKGWTQEDIARKLNVSRSAVTKWETGEAMPSSKRLIALTHLFGCTIDHLLYEKA